MSSSYNVLQPIGTIITGSITLGDYLEKMFFLLIGISGVLAVVMLVICGIKLMMSEGAGGREAAKKCIWDAIFGLLIAIGAWLLLNTINPQLVGSTLSMETSSPTTQSTAAEGTTAGTAVDEPAPRNPGWYIHYQEGLSQKYKKFKPNEGQLCSSILDAMRAQGLTILPGGPNNVAGCFEVFLNAGGATSASESAVRGSLCGEARVDGCLSTAGVQIDKRMCSNPGIYEPGCTTVGGLPQSSINFIKTLPGLCGGCSVLITGGVEKEATNHIDGQDIFDLRLSQGDALYNAVTGSGVSQVSFSGNRRWLYNGFWFTDDQTSGVRNWHVCKDGINDSYCMACGAGNTLCPPATGPIVVGSGGGGRGSCTTAAAPALVTNSFINPTSQVTLSYGSHYDKAVGIPYRGVILSAPGACPPVGGRIDTARGGSGGVVTLTVKDSTTGAVLRTMAQPEVNSLRFMFTNNGQSPDPSSGALSGYLFLQAGKTYRVEMTYDLSAAPTDFHGTIDFQSKFDSLPCPTCTTFASTDPGRGLWVPRSGVYVVDQSGPDGAGGSTIAVGCVNGGSAAFGEPCREQTTYTGRYNGTNYTFSLTQGKIVSIRYYVDPSEPVAAYTGSFNFRSVIGGTLPYNATVSLSETPGDFSNPQCTVTASRVPDIRTGTDYCPINPTKIVYYLNIKLNVPCSECVFAIVENADQLDGPPRPIGTGAASADPGTGLWKPDPKTYVFSKMVTAEPFIPRCVPNEYPDCRYGARSTYDTVRAGEVWVLRVPYSAYTSLQVGHISVARAETGESLNVYDVSLSKTIGDFSGTGPCYSIGTGAGSAVYFYDPSLGTPRFGPYCQLTEKNTMYYFNVRPRVGSSGETSCGTSAENACRFRMMLYGMPPP